MCLWLASVCARIFFTVRKKPASALSVRGEKETVYDQHPMKCRLALFLMAMAAALSAQRPKPDLIKTSEGQLSIQPVFHGALVLTWNNNTIYVDPYGGAKAYSGLKSP